MATEILSDSGMMKDNIIGGEEVKELFISQGIEKFFCVEITINHELTWE